MKGTAGAERKPDAHNQMAARGLDDYGSKAIYSVRASVGLSESLNTWQRAIAACHS